MTVDTCQPAGYAAAGGGDDTERTGWTSWTGFAGARQARARGAAG
jgi:hypothetical protein